jgi:hypothetical protein
MLGGLIVKKQLGIGGSAALHPGHRPRVGLAPPRRAPRASTSRAHRGRAPGGVVRELAGTGPMIAAAQPRQA